MARFSLCFCNICKGEVKISVLASFEMLSAMQNDIQYALQCLVPQYYSGVLSFFVSPTSAVCTLQASSKDIFQAIAFVPKTADGPAQLSTQDILDVVCYCSNKAYQILSAPGKFFGELI